MKVDLSTLGRGDTIVLRNYDCHRVLDVQYGYSDSRNLYFYSVLTESERPTYWPNYYSRVMSHKQDGRLLLECELDGDIVYVIPSSDGVQKTQSEGGVFERLAQTRKAFERATSLGLARKPTAEEASAEIRSLIRSGESPEEVQRIVMGSALAK